MCHSDEIIVRNYIDGMQNLLPGKMPDVELYDNQLMIGTTYILRCGTDRLNIAKIMFEPDGVPVTLYLGKRKPMVMIGDDLQPCKANKKMVNHIVSFLEAMDCPVKLPPLKRKKGQVRIISKVITFESEAPNGKQTD